MLEESRVEFELKWVKKRDIVQTGVSKVIIISWILI